jgi:hypothetical protein
MPDLSRSGPLKGQLALGFCNADDIASYMYTGIKTTNPLLPDLVQLSA